MFRRIFERAKEEDMMSIKDASQLETDEWMADPEGPEHLAFDELRPGLTFYTEDEVPLGTIITWGDVRELEKYDTTDAIKDALKKFDNDSLIPAVAVKWDDNDVFTGTTVEVYGSEFEGGFCLPEE